MLECGEIILVLLDAGPAQTQQVVSPDLAHPEVVLQFACSLQPLPQLVPGTGLLAFTPSGKCCLDTQGASASLFERDCRCAAKVINIQTSRVFHVLAVVISSNVPLQHHDSLLPLVRFPLCTLTCLTLLSSSLHGCLARFCCVRLDLGVLRCTLLAQEFTLLPQWPELLLDVSLLAQARVHITDGLTVSPESVGEAGDPSVASSRGLGRIGRCNHTAWKRRWHPSRRRTDWVAHLHGDVRR